MAKTRRVAPSKSPAAPAHSRVRRAAPSSTSRAACAKRLVSAFFPSLFHSYLRPKLFRFYSIPRHAPPPGVKNGFIKSCLGCRSVAESPRGVTRPLPAPPRFFLAPVDSARVLRFCPGFAPARCSCSVLFLLSCPDCAPAMPRNPDMLPRLPRFFRTGLRGNRVASGFLRTSTTLVLNRDFEAG